MTATAFAFYDSFAATILGGSQAAIISESADIEKDLRIRLAKEIGAPATCFVDWVAGDQVKAQFFSTVAELPMCGHGTVALMTRLFEQGILGPSETDVRNVNLILPAAVAKIALRLRREDGRLETMLNVKIPKFAPAKLDFVKLAELLGISPADYHPDLPIEVASADFVHLVVPLSGLRSMKKLAPNFAALAAFCRAHGLVTVAAFTTEVEQQGRNLHVRDFCPAVGVAESAAAGTTNAALASYLLRHHLLKPDHNGLAKSIAEQGHEIGRPSSIYSELQVDSDAITTLKVGGIASKVLDGVIHLPNSTQQAARQEFATALPALRPSA